MQMSDYRQFIEEFGEDELITLEKEFILQTKQLSRDDLRKLIAQERAIQQLNTFVRKRG